MKDLSKPVPERKYVIEFTEPELMKIIALSYSFECPSNLGENYSNPYLTWDQVFPDLSFKVHRAQDRIGIVKDNIWEK
jgi:hypothetical protein